MTRARSRRTCWAALGCLPERARRSGRVAMRADAGYFAGALPRTTRHEHIGFAIGAKRIGRCGGLITKIAEEYGCDLA
jgi:hypothetical protein